MAPSADAGESGTGTAETTASDAPAATEAEVATVLEAAHAGAVAYAEAAAERATDPRVRAFARAAGREHAGLRAEAARLARELGATDVVTWTVEEMRADVRDALGTLGAADDREFDAAFVAREIDLQRQTLDLLGGLHVAARTAPLRQAIDAATARAQADLEAATRLGVELSRHAAGVRGDHRAVDQPHRDGEAHEA